MRRAAHGGARKIPAGGAGVAPPTPRPGKSVEDAKKQFAGVELPNRTLGIIGLGAIGSLVADTAIKLGMKVVGFDPEITVDAAWRLPSSVRKANSIEELLKQSDFVTLHVPLLDVTRHLIDEKRLAVMKSGAALLNFARDGIVDEDAVIAALRARRLKYYLCDFPSAKLLHQPGVAAPPSRRVDRGSGGELRGHGRRSGARISGKRRHRQRGQFP